MTIIIEHYPCRQPAMTALIRGALKTDPSKAQPPRNTAVHTPSGGGGRRRRGNPGPGPWAPQPSKLLLIRPWGRTLTTLFHNEPPPLPPLHFLALTLPPSLPLHPCLWFIKLMYTQERHLHKRREGWGGGELISVWTYESYAP